ncbi:M48 family metallopeptidase [Nitrospina watsonii]|uniref:Peptidase M48, Ste24p (Modular protein) n=1 Tax=Nitrospina watsonii TaxID=1323948 RepID=A0ABM9HFP6_9BACT|nr:M48 family metallopeptidase [Nitrospina watsonii]CAI2719052.1 Peptidase M48, Ste24p (Modular protein) [Nitrospina watsonii]
MLKKYLAATLALCALVYGCVTTPVSENSALILIPFSQEVSLGQQAFQEISAKETLSTNLRLQQVIERVGRRLVIETSMADLDWEFKLFASKQMNAFALPGGKVGVYEGILPVCSNEAGLAAVLGHEIAHAVARHGAQRMSQQLLITGALAASSIRLSDHKNRGLILGALGVGAQYGVTLPFGRGNESEADEIGVIYMARAGYDPREAVRFWQRFSSMKQGAQPPEFLSTHPADERRIRDIETLLPEAMRIYNAHPNKQGLGESFLYILNEERLKNPGGTGQKRPAAGARQPVP